jgi:AAA15 family ATPase/GTPase
LIQFDLYLPKNLMLIEFSVSNFRSFRERQTLSMVAAPRLHKRENVFTPAVKGEKLPDLLKVAAVYGPNASGKSNLMEALGMFRSISGTAKMTELPIKPFRFDPAMQNQASEFEWNFVTEGVRYCYVLAATTKRIIKEALYVFPSGKETLLYFRSFDGVTETYQFGDSLEGGDLVHQAWQNLTGPQMLFISQAVANSNEKLQQLRKPFAWLDSVISLVDGMELALEIAIEGVEKRPISREPFTKFLQEIDVPVTKIDFAGGDELSPLEKIRFTHQTALGNAQFNLQEESDGTQNLMGFWVCWQGLINNEQQLVNLFAIDELDSSLHPNIIIALLKKRLELEHPTQMIFTTHDTHLMDAKILRRDQFWITERDANGATQLLSLIHI